LHFNFKKGSVLRNPNLIILASLVLSAVTLVGCSGVESTNEGQVSFSKTTNGADDDYDNPDNYDDDGNPVIPGDDGNSTGSGGGDNVVPPVVVTPPPQSPPAAVAPPVSESTSRFGVSAGQLNCSGSGYSFHPNSGVTVWFTGQNTNGACAASGNSLSVKAHGYPGWVLHLQAPSHVSLFPQRPENYWTQIQHDDGVMAKVKEIKVTITSQMATRVLHYTVNGRIPGLPEANFNHAHYAAENSKLLLLPGSAFDIRQFNTLDYQITDIDGRQAQTNTGYAEQVYILPNREDIY